MANYTLVDFKFLQKEYLFILLSSGILSFILTYISIPKILKISYGRNLLTTPNERSSHIREIPHFGGVAIFYSMIICCTIFAQDLVSYRFLYSAIILLFFTGVMDDFLPLKATNKLIVQIIAALLITIGSDVRIKSFFGILGIYELNYYISILFSVIVFISIINAYNLIDGIDGLAASIGIIACFAFFFVFFRLMDFTLTIVCISLATSLLAFLRYNFSENKKIFMGDTGSMLVGFLISFMAIKFINLCNESYINFNNSPAIAIAILIVPISDTLNVTFLRIINRENILKADKRHIHHKLLNLNFSHKQATLTISIFYILILFIAYYLRHLDILLLIIIILFLGFLFAISPNIIAKFKGNIS